LDINNGICLQYGITGPVGISWVTITLPQSYTTLYRVVGSVCAPQLVMNMVFISIQIHYLLFPVPKGLLGRVLQTYLLITFVLDTKEL